MKLSTAIRSYQASVRRQARELEREQRAAIRQHKRLLKEQMIAEAEAAVEDYENYINILNSVHKHCSEEIEWQSLAEETEPLKPKPQYKWSKSAEKELKAFKPSFFDKIFNLSTKKIKSLQDKFLKAKEKDNQINSEKLNSYKEEFREWKETSELAKSVLNKDINSYKSAFDLFSPFDELTTIGSTISIEFEKDFAKAYLEVNDDEVIPKYSLKQNANGKLSKKELPKSKFNEFYQDYICSCAIRVCRELFSMLPISYVILNAESKLLNSSTGLLEDKIILSVIIPRSTLNTLNIEHIDPSDSMENFVHNMKFSKLKGFSSVHEVDYKDIVKVK